MIDGSSVAPIDIGSNPISVDHCKCEQRRPC